MVITAPEICPPGLEPCFAYVRISEDREGAGLGVERQLAEVRILAARLNWHITRVFEDNDIDASSGKPRPAYIALCKELDKGQVKNVAVWHTDRLHRRPDELEPFVDLCERHGITVQGYKAGKVDLATAAGRAIARTLGAWARYEIEHMVERQVAKNEQRANSGIQNWPARPFGFVDADADAKNGEWRNVKNLALHPVEAPLIAKAYQRVLSGGSLGSIASEWNVAGITTSKGCKFRASTVRKILLKERNAGLRAYGGKILEKRGNWPAIVSDDMYYSVVDILNDPKRHGAGQAKPRKYILSGLALCGRCGKPVGSMKNSVTRKTNYACKHCLGIGRDRIKVDGAVLRIITEKLSQPEAVELLIDNGADNRAELAEQVESLRIRRKAAAVAAADADDPDDVDFHRTQHARLSQRYKETMALMTDHVMADIFEGVPLGTADVGPCIAGLPLDRQRAIIDCLITITILPAHGKAFHISQLKVEPKAEATWLFEAAA